MVLSGFPVLAGPDLSEEEARNIVSRGKYRGYQDSMTVRYRPENDEWVFESVDVDSNCNHCDEFRIIVKDNKADPKVLMFPGH